MLYNSSVSHFFVNFLTYVTTPFHQPGIIWAPIRRNHLSSLEEKLAPWRPRSSAFPSLWGFLTPRPERTCLAGPGGGGLLVWCFWVVAFFFIVNLDPESHCAAWAGFWLSTALLPWKGWDLDGHLHIQMKNIFLIFFLLCLWSQIHPLKGWTWWTTLY